MKRRNIFITILLAFVMFISSCANITTNEYSYSLNTEEIGDFELVSPTNGQESITVPTFNWNKATNADSYTLEVCSSTRFDQIEDTVYIKKTGIVDNKFTISAGLKNKDTTYYWKVTAKNQKKSKVCAQGYSSFYLKSNSDEEIEFNIEYADEWKVHEEGSQAEVSIDKSNFFKNDKSALAISFDASQTNRGIPESDGWIVITHQQETEMYGVDAFKFNFYYSGENSRIFLRVVDDDNEYWNAEIKLANNNKQTVFIGFDEFTLRTKGGTTIANQVFDYNYIKYVEIVFEETFGDGVCLISDLKAVSSEKYKHLFMEELDFNSIDKEKIILDNYNFDTDFSEDGKSMTMSYYSGPNDKNTSGINGYGFVKLVVNKFMKSGDALKLKLRHTGNKDANILIRVLEEDDDRWVYRQSVKTLDDNYLILPYNAFTLSEYKGDGSRQFYYLKQLQVGIEKTYSTGSVTIEDVKIVTMADEIDGLYDVTIQDDGLIDDFNSYTDTAQIYYKWQNSISNKDEAMELNSEFAFGNNNKCVKLGYKSDMGPAYYGVRFVNSVENFNAISFNAFDYSTKKAEAYFNHIESVSAKCIVSIFVNTGEEYIYTINALNRYWSKYVIPFDEFVLAEEYFGDITPLDIENISGVRIGFQYYYYLENGTPYPVYADKNPVYFDDLRFTNADEVSVSELATKLTPESDNEKVTIVDDFDSKGASKNGFMWNCDKGEVSKQEDQDNNYMKMDYNGTYTYNLDTLFESNCVGKAISFDLIGDGKADVIVEIELTRAGATSAYQYTFADVSSSLNRYVVGFDNFTKTSGTGSVALSSKYVPNITKISFIVKGNEQSYVLIDNILLDANYAYDVSTITPIGG